MLRYSDAGFGPSFLRGPSGRPSIKNRGAATVESDNHLFAVGIPDSSAWQGLISGGHFAASRADTSHYLQRG